MADLFNQAQERQRQKVAAAQENFAASLGLASVARVRELEAKVRELRTMIDGASIACDSGGTITLTWGA